MITRAQAEALSTLAESLEACERLGMSLAILNNGVRLHYAIGESTELEGLYAHDIRVEVRTKGIKITNTGEQP